MQPLASSRMTELAELVEAFNRLTSDLDARIRELARARDEVRDVLNAINEGVVALNADARLVRINEAAMRILDVEPVPALTHVSLFVRSAELRLLMEAAPSHAVGAREVHLGEKRYLVSGRPLGAGGAVITFVDVSEIRRLEEVRSDFVANASHELKTPLTAVRGFSETLLEDDPPEDLRQSFLDLIWRNTVRLQRLVEDLLDLSRLESGGWVPQSEPVRVEEVAVKAWVQAEPRDSESSVRLHIDGAGIATADARGLSQIFQNLFDNALRHTPSGGSIRVQVESEEGEDLLRVSVRDTGSGILPAHLPRIFERFYRVDPARSRAEGGTGLGLAIVRHLVIAMGGEVWAESVIEEGTTIRFTLPRGSATSLSLMELDEEDDDDDDDELDYGDFVAASSMIRE
ncbi:MAG: histidine kinase [Gammaproteobacteria bacterium]|nr:histidine kinase [Gammaproteobacteria bacterium]